MTNLRPIDRAYIAGFFDGEGCVTFRDRFGGRPWMSITQKDPKVLQHIQSLLGCGRLHPKDKGQCWRLIFTSKADMELLIEVIYRYTIVKRRILARAKRDLSKRSGWGKDARIRAQQ